MASGDFTRGARAGAYQFRSADLARHFAHPPKDSAAHIDACRAARFRFLASRAARIRQAIKDTFRGMELQ